MSMSPSYTFALRGVIVLLLGGVAAGPAAGQSREQRQLMADVRMLQEQNQTLQNLLGSIAEAIKAVNARIDEQATITGKALADQKLSVTNITNSMREIREKLDDNTVRLGSLSQEVDAVRLGLQQLSALPALNAPAPGAGVVPGTPGASAATAGSGPPPPGATPPPASTDPGLAAAPPAATPPPAPPIGTSPQALWDEAYADYGLGQYDLAIAGFQTLITYFPRTERAADAQVLIGNSYMQSKNDEKAAEAYEAAIRNYPGSPALPEAYYRRGIALKNLKQPDRARESFEFLVKTFPDSAEAQLARQQLAQK
jgi:tol-pal system protein YbgF